MNKSGLSRSVLLEALANNGVIQRSSYQKTFEDAATQTDFDSVMYAVSGGFLDEFRRFKELVQNHENLLAGITPIKFSNTSYHIDDVATTSSSVPQVIVSETVNTPTEEDISQMLLNLEDDKEMEEHRDSQHCEDGLISIGPNKTIVPLAFYQNIDWTTPSKATRSLLSCVFGEITLATSTMTGKLSPAFPDKPKKGKLDPKKIEDIIYVITKRCSVSTKDVRSVIKSKCADAGKILKTRLERATS